MIPDNIDGKINKMLDEVLKDSPEATNKRESFYQQLLQYYDENGELPDIKLVEVIRNSTVTRFRIVAQVGSYSNHNIIKINSNSRII